MMYDYLPGIFSPILHHWLAAPCSDFAFVLQEAAALLDQHPHLLQTIEEDLRTDALVKKEVRLKDRQARHQQHLFLAGTEVVGAQPVSQPQQLGQGRPRMSARTCYFFLIIRGYLGGIKSQQARDFLAESLSVHLYLAREGIPMPSLSTILENTNKLSQQTRDAILDSQIQWIKQRGLDDFQDITVDSTATEANSCWPTDSHLMLALAKRLWRDLDQVENFGLPKLEDEQLPEILEDMGRLNFEIACASGKKDADKIREEKYTEFYNLAEATSQFFAEALYPLRQVADQQKYLPSRKRKLEAHLAGLEQDLALLDHIIHYSIERVLEKRKVPTQEKVTSISDPDASFISKGQRETQLGYRPQVSKSSTGFAIAILVPEGNAADSEQLRPICEATFRRTGVIPYSASFDDGYTSHDNRQWLKEEMGVAVVSFSGAKGKKITPEEDWLAAVYREARRMRSAVESVIFQIKHCFSFGRVLRRGIDKVRQELTEKVVAFNFYRLQYLTRL
ncbi:MAG: transposase [Gammaproteobacteria bacterium]|nr:transposase [Gammaproteobacteria bacterium]